MTTASADYWIQRIYHDLAGTSMPAVSGLRFGYWLQQIYGALTSTVQSGLDQRSDEFWSRAIYFALAGATGDEYERSITYWWQRIYALSAGTSYPDGSDGRSLEYWLEQVQLVGLAPAPQPFTPADLTNLVAYFKLDEAAGTRADATGRGNDLDSLPGGEPGAAAGKIAGGLKIVPGLFQYAKRADTADLSVNGTSYCFFGWAKLASKGQQRHVFAKRGGLPFAEYYLRYDDATDRMIFYNTDNDGVTAATFGSPPLNTWFFFCCWVDVAGPTVNIQINDGAVDSIPRTTAAPDGASDFSVGALQTNLLLWDGVIDELGLCKSVPTAAQRTSLYNGGSGVTL